MPTRVAFDVLRDFIVRSLQAGGMPAADAATVAHLMAEADLQGSDGHGVIRLAPLMCAASAMAAST